MNSFNELFKKFCKYCKKNNVNTIVFFFAIEAICGRNYLEVKQDFWLNRLKLSQKEAKKLKVFIDKCEHEPWQYIIGKGLFAGKWYRIAPRVFIPRETSEQVLEILKEKVKTQEKINSIWEVGVGSGVVLWHVGKLFSNAKLFGTDIDPDALKIANINCSKATLWLDDWVSNYKANGEIELIIANPPYVLENDEVDSLTHSESKQALYGTKLRVTLYYVQLIELMKIRKTLLKYLLFEIPTKILGEIREILSNSEFAVTIFSSPVKHLKFVLIKKKQFLVNEPIHKHQLYMKANAHLKANRIIVYPTDTCYGIIARYTVENLRIMNTSKGRSGKMLIPILFNRFEQIKELPDTQRMFFKPNITVIYSSEHCGARKIFTNKYFLQSLIKNNGPLLATSWNKHNCQNIISKDIMKIFLFPKISAFFFDNNYEAKKPSKIIKLRKSNKILLIRNNN